MKVLAPLTSSLEVEPLCVAGADQFYCGLVNRGASLNDRPNTEKFNFSSVEEISRATQIAHKFKKKVFLTLNSPFSPINDSLTQAKLAQEIGIDGVIVANPLLMKNIKEKGFDFDLCASCLTAVFNYESARFFKKLGVKVLHLPRQIGIEEIESIAKNVSGIGLSVFGLHGMCINIEAFCSLHYLKEEYFIPCHNFRTINIIGKHNISEEEIDKRINSPRISCGICAFRKLKQIGISSIKIEGRGCSTETKIKHVSIAKKALNEAREHNEERKYREICRKLFKESFNEQCKKEFCYF